MLNLQRKSLNTSLLFLHLCLQIIIPFWSTILDGNPLSSMPLNIKIVTYLSYSLLLANIIAFSVLSSRPHIPKTIIYYLPIIINILVSAGILYFVLDGYVNESNKSAHVKMLYQLYLMQTIIALVVTVCIMFGNVGWADRYSHWPGNLALPILILKQRMSWVIYGPTLAIAILLAIVSFTSFVINIVHFRTLDVNGSKLTMLKAHWSISMVILIVVEVMGVVLLVIYGKDGDYMWHYGRAVLVGLLAVNGVDFFFWFYGWRRLQKWATHTVS